MNTVEKIQYIRKKMADAQISAYIIPTTDPHQCEYPPEYWRMRSFISGFTGSAGVLVICADFAGLWTDSRYFIQADKQLNGSGIELMKAGNSIQNDYIDWLTANLSENSSIAVFGETISCTTYKVLLKKLQSKKIKIETELDFVSEIWKERPALSTEKIILHEEKYSGKNVQEKLDSVRKKIAEKKADFLLVAALDEIAWLLNIRGKDIPYNPVVVSYLLIGMEQCFFFLNKDKLTTQASEYLENNKITTEEYSSFFTHLPRLLSETTLLYSPAKLAFSVLKNLSKEIKTVETESIVQPLKAIKNETEIENLKRIHTLDGLAVTRLWFWVENSMGKHKISEADVANKVEEFRAENAEYLGKSFGTIAAYGANGAIVHYEPETETCAELKPLSLFLLDSGGQYLGGTTDITRTFSMGKPTEIEKKDFTLALKGTIDLAKMKFPAGTQGYQLDAFARKGLWRYGMNYGHGTGHGVGYLLNVHEAPPSISTSAANQNAGGFQKNMVLTIEPGFYRTNVHGVRTENMVVTSLEEQTEWGEFLRFDTLTLCPIDTALIDYNILSRAEKAWLQQYHTRVYAELSPLLPEEEKDWLKKKCEIG